MQDFLFGLLPLVDPKRDRRRISGPPLPPGAVPFAGRPAIDTRMPLAPEWKVSMLGRYVRELPAGSRVAFQADATYYAEQYFDAFNSPNHREPGYTVGNVRASWYSPASKWEITAFVDNVTDKVYRTTAFDLAFLGFATDVYGKPRWAGLSVGYKW